jgi:multiple sugar transport system ATP-binding protein
MATEDRVEQVQEAQAQGTTVGGGSGGASRAGAA